jgi:hypothetical protein
MWLTFIRDASGSFFMQIDIEYGVISVLRVEMDIIISIAASLIEQAAILTW